MIILGDHLLLAQAGNPFQVILLGYLHEFGHGHLGHGRNIYFGRVLALVLSLVLVLALVGRSSVIFHFLVSPCVIGRAIAASGPAPVVVVLRALLRVPVPSFLRRRF